MRNLKIVNLVLYLLIISLSFCFDESEASIKESSYRWPWHRYELDEFSQSEKSRICKENAYAKESSAYSSLQMLKDRAWVEIDVRHKGYGWVLRYSIPDSEDGKGIELPLKIILNGKIIENLTLSSRLSHNYGNVFKQETNDPDDPKSGNHCRFFDELRFRCPTKPGDKLRLMLPKVPNSEQPVLLDFLEQEEIPKLIRRPANSLCLVKDFGAIPNDGKSDLIAFEKGIKKSSEQKKILYMPSGRYDIPYSLILPSYSRIQGAGIWYSEIYFLPEPRKRLPKSSLRRGGDDRPGGFLPRGSYIELRDFYFASNGKHRYTGCQPFNGFLGQDSVLENLWWEHTGNARLLKGKNLVVRSCRARNIVAGGIILFGGQQDSIIEYCHVRYAADDGIGSFASGGLQNHNIIIRHNWVELNEHAAAIGLFGGIGSKVIDNRITQSLPSAQADLRFTTSFDQMPFGKDITTFCHRNKLESSSAKYGAILFGVLRSPTWNIHIKDTIISDLRGRALYFRYQKNNFDLYSDKIVLENLSISPHSNNQFEMLHADRRFSGEVHFMNVDLKGNSKSNEIKSQNLKMTWNEDCNGWLK